MTPTTIQEELASGKIAALDLAWIHEYNLRARENYQIRDVLGPSAFEGDVDNARVVLLFANPGFDETSTPDDHGFARPGWPLAGLHPEAPNGLRNWWTIRLRGLIELCGAQQVSQRLACLQITPWASRNFDESLSLPSRSEILSAANRIAERGAVLIIMRAERLWLEARSVASSLSRYRVRSWRCSYLSEGNLGTTAWIRVRDAIDRV